MVTGDVRVWAAFGCVGIGSCERCSEPASSTEVGTLFTVLRQLKCVNKIRKRYSGLKLYEQFPALKCIKARV
jgi:hypothetical protein